MEKVCAALALHHIVTDDSTRLPLMTATVPDTHRSHLTAHQNQCTDVRLAVTTIYRRAPSRDHPMRSHGVTPSQMANVSETSISEMPKATRESIFLSAG